MYKLEKYKHKLMHVNGGGGWLVSKVTDPYLNDVEQKQVYKREYLRLKQVGGGGLEMVIALDNQIDEIHAQMGEIIANAIINKLMVDDIRPIKEKLEREINDLEQQKIPHINLIREDEQQTEQFIAYKMKRIAKIRKEFEAAKLKTQKIEQQIK